MKKEWGDFLKEKFGAGLESGQVTDFGHPEAELRAALNGSDLCSDLSHLGLIAVQGPDADQFLQGQLTCDVRQATHDHSVLGAFCTPKAGRSPVSGCSGGRTSCIWNCRTPWLNRC